MKKLLLLLSLSLVAAMSYGQAGPCNATLAGTSTTVVSSTMLMDSAGSTNAQNNILVCGGSTLTYNWYLGKDFYIQNGATLILKSAQIAKIYLESGATLVFDTAGQVFPGGTTINGITYDSTNVIFVDTNQIMIPNAAVYWNHCLNNTFNYTVFTPAQPCGPSSVDNSLQTALDVTFINPLFDRLQFHSLVNQQIAGIKIIDLSGKLMQEISNPQKSIDVSYLPRGMYLIQFTAKNGEQLVKKILKD